MHTCTEHTVAASKLKRRLDLSDRKRFLYNPRYPVFIQVVRYPTLLSDRADFSVNSVPYYSTINAPRVCGCNIRADVLCEFNAACQATNPASVGNSDRFRMHAFDRSEYVLNELNARPNRLDQSIDAPETNLVPFRRYLREDEPPWGTCDTPSQSVRRNAGLAELARYIIWLLRFQSESLPIIWTTWNALFTD